MKALGCIAVLLSAYIYGVYCAKGLKNKSKHCEQVYSAMKYCLEQVKKRTPTEVISERLCKLYPDTFTKEGMPYPADAELCASDELGDTVKCFFDSLGSLSVEEQSGELEYQLEKMKRLTDAQKEKNTRDAAVCRLLPLFFAALAVILKI